MAFSYFNLVGSPLIVSPISRYTLLPQYPFHFGIACGSMFNQVSTLVVSVEHKIRWSCLWSAPSSFVPALRHAQPILLACVALVVWAPPRVPLSLHFSLVMLVWPAGYTHHVHGHVRAHADSLSLAAYRSHLSSKDTPGSCWHTTLISFFLYIQPEPCYTAHVNLFF